MNKSIYVVFDKNEILKIGLHIDEEILRGLLDPYSVVVDINDIKAGNVSLENAKAIMDCTSKHVFYNNSINKKTGSEFKVESGKKIIKTLKGNFLMKGIPLLDIMLAANSRNNVPSMLSNSSVESEMERETISKLDKNLELLMSEHHAILRELGDKIPYIVNERRYERAMNSEGIDIEIGSFRDVKYKLVKDDSVNVGPGFERITPSDIKVLKDLHSIMENLK
ncbi:MAG: hypothetical protein ACRC0G_04365 [Fusobacteriaceae bacterium]